MSVWSSFDMIQSYSPQTRKNRSPRRDRPVIRLWAPFDEMSALGQKIRDLLDR
jgi:hypothetical protein